jgi:hypothetical protein
MTTLQEMCYNQLAKSMETAPPLLQEMVMGETCQRVKENMKKEVREEMMPEVEKEVKKSMCNILPYLIPEIMQDIISAMTEDGRMRRNFRDEYIHLGSDVIECAIQTAETAVTTMEDHYVYRAFNTLDTWEFNS